MHHSKCIRILQTLTAWELNSLQSYIESPFFNKNEKVIELWQYIRKFAPDFVADELSMEQVSTTLIGGSFDAQRLRYLLTDLTRLCEGFLAYKKWEADSMGQQYALIQAYEERKLEKYYTLASRKLSQRLYANPPRSTRDFSDRFLFVEQQYVAEINRKRTKQAYPITSVMETLDQFYLAKKLRYSAELINRANVYNESSKQFLTDEIIRSVEEFPELTPDLVLLYLNTLLTLVDGKDETHYYTLKNGLEEQLQYLDRSELNHLYTFALNYCIRQLNAGKGEFAREIFELFKVLVENRIIFVNENLPPAHFKNVVTIGTRLQEYDWTEQFIEEYQHFLPESEAFNAYTYNRSYLLFAKGDYRRLLRLLSTVEFSDVFYQLDGKTILLKTYYELEDYDTLLYLMGSFRIYLTRNKTVSETYRKLYLNLIRIVKLIVRHRLGEKVSLKKIQQQLTKRPDIAAGNWVKEKIKELEVG